MSYVRLRTCDWCLTKHQYQDSFKLIFKHYEILTCSTKCRSKISKFMQKK